MNKSTRLKELITSSKLEFILEAHNGLSAKIVEEAGFQGIWGSGLSISAAMGVRDNNEASWTQILEVVEFMSDATGVPILLDGDTGFGDFNNVRRLIRKLEQRSIAGVCIEDKLFPKTNSFIEGERQPLADIQEFCGKIMAGKDSQMHPDFCIVARVEALITGWGIEEALKRAHAYAEAGADAILMHSKKKEPDEILEFMRQWDGAKPIVIVPTTYGTIPSKEFEKAGVSLIVWANHMLRASIGALQTAAQKIAQEQSIMQISKEIVPVKEIFRLQNAQELQEASARYRPLVKARKAVVLAASRGKELGELTAEKPKCMIPVHGKPILARLVSTFNDSAIKNITVVVGYKQEAVTFPNINKIQNPAYESTGILESLYCARDELDGEVVISYGDILFSKEVLRDLLEAEGDIVLKVDTAWIQGDKRGRLKDVVYCDTPHSHEYMGSRSARINALASKETTADASGEWIGLLKLSENGAQIIRTELEAFRNAAPEEFKTADVMTLLQRMIDNGVSVQASYYSGHWLDIDGVEDLTYAGQRASV